MLKKSMLGLSFKEPKEVRKPNRSVILLVLLALAVPYPAQAQRLLAQAAGDGCRSGSGRFQPEPPYTLGAGDRIAVDIFNVPEYSREYQVLVNGALNLALIGNISVQGLTLQQATNVISSQYARFLRRPIVTLNLVAARPVRVAISGEVNRPGSYSIPLTTGAASATGTGIQLPTLTQAISLAGGVTTSAELNRVQVLRPRLGSVNLNLLGLVRRGELCEDITLRDGDSVIIPTSTTVNLAAANEIATSGLAPTQNVPLNIVVAGEVTRPGPIIVQPDATGALPTVSRAIQVAGGITQSADLSRVQVRRNTRGGGQQVVAVNIDRVLQGGDRRLDLILQQGDTVFVPTASQINPAQTSRLANSSLAPTQIQPLNILVAGEVNRPGPQVVQPDATGALPTVSRAIQVAGGIRQSADISRIEVRRNTQTGGQQGIVINLNQALQGGDRRQDLVLQQGDTIVVPTAPQINPTQTFGNTNSTLAPTQNVPINIVVVGEVTRPGPYNVQPTQTGAPPTLSRALQAAGGITQSADISRVELRRLSRAGEVQATTLNLQQLVQGGDRRQDIFLQEGDSIFVPTAAAVNAAQSLEIASSSIAADPSQPLNVIVVGEVLRPGAYTIQPFRPAPGVAGALPSFAGLPTVSQAIQQAGGITQTADIRRVEIRRTTRLGSQQILVANFWQLLQSGDRTQDLILQQGDTIFIPAAVDINPAEAAQLAVSTIAPATIRINVVGEVVRPGTVQVPPNTSLNQGLLAAGGFNNVRARRTSVDLIRLNPNGTVTKRSIQVNLSRGINEEGNPILRDNDVILVNRSFAAEVSDGLRVFLDPIGNFFSIFNFFNIFGN